MVTNNRTIFGSEFFLNEEDSSLFLMDASVCTDPEQYVHKLQKSGRLSVEVCAIVKKRQILEVMVPSVVPVFGNDYTFQQGNCPVHTARLVIHYLEENNIEVLPWPSRSPDLNPIENIWGFMTKKIQSRQHQPQNHTN